MLFLRPLPLALSLATCAPAPILAQTANTLCGPRHAITEHLETRYGETVRSAGLAGPNRIVEVYASDETGSWTITVTAPDGTMCLLASGQAFHAVAPAPTGAPT